ncbi:hypothetical protein IGI04_037159 [Brassica rapa subsp. trilocularis]|uniref:Uncharacterized protein n=1 Tax=Brassica rapa subsp. trilocularis TaxID=1813537 RepID=A0ABQ7LGK7_BRACM|nr:hypothetical protein IGI04_037159 [Brassica rapa subsp. trilocularis]
MPTPFEDQAEQSFKSKKNCPFASSTSTSLYTSPIGGLFFFCLRSSLSLRRNIPFSFDLRVYFWKLHIYLLNLTFIFCRIKDKTVITIGLDFA